jgi:hypothetical protein
LLQVAWKEFLLDEKATVPPRDHPDFPTTFIPWFLFTWIPDAEEAERKTLPQEPAAVAYLEEHGKELDDFERRFILEACRSGFSFYSVLEVEPGRGLRLSDILTHREVSVVDHSARRDGTAGSDSLREARETTSAPFPSTGSGSATRCTSAWRIPPSAGSKSTGRGSRPT